MNTKELEERASKFAYARASWKAGYEAACRDRWHKVAGGDLPKEEGDYLFYLYDQDTKKYFTEVLGFAPIYADRKEWYIESTIWTIDDVIAWCEIPKYEEDE